MTIQKADITVSLGQLLLDPNNYRLNIGDEPKEHTVEEIKKLQPEIRKQLIRKNTSDLEMSIFKNGFLEVDKIVVREAPDGSELPKYLVVEGNRRTAAFKSLIINNYDEKKEKFHENFREDLIQKSSNINVILINGTEEEIDDYARRLMGIRHVSGPKKWDAYQSAKLINDMINSDQNYQEIGSLLGMRPKEVQKKHEAYNLFHQMKSDPLYGEHANIGMFSLFIEAASANKYFKEVWLGWSDQDKIFHNTTQLHRLYRAIIPNKNGSIELNNPTIFRDFSRKISIQEVRDQIESGVPFQDVDYDFDHEKRLKKIRDFSNFIEKFNHFSDEEYDYLIVLKSALDTKISSRGSH